MEKFIKVLEKVKEVSAWKINRVHKKSCELFYVLDKLETTRATDTESYDITVYVDIDGKRGASTFSAYDYMSEEDLLNKIKDNVFSASFALNEFYELPKKNNEEIIKSSSNLKDAPFNEIIEKIVDATFKANTYKNGYLSATEFFLYEITNQVINSNGVNVSAISYKGEIELIPSWEKDDKEVEIYHMIKFETVDLEDITRQVDEVLQLAKARFDAVDLKLDKDVKIIIQDEEVAQYFSFFSNDLNYASKYQKINFCELGESVQGDNITGDKITMKKVPYYNNAIGSRLIDQDGVVLKEREIIKDSIAVARFGSNRFGQYLKEEPTGNLPIIVVNAGSKSFSEMTKEPYIRCVKFSGIQVEPNSGFLGGEVRLGFYFDGEKEIPVTSFSISGNLHELKGTIIFSKEETTTSYYHGPKYLEIKGMKIC